MDVDAPLALLGGLSPARFMRRHWQKEPLLVRQAWPGVRPPLKAAALFALAARDDVESRLVRRPAVPGERWQLECGPIVRAQRPRARAAGWSLLVQGLDLHDEAARTMLDAFRFVPDARLDDLMVSLAGDGGGVGPHLDSYDVFLLQVQGRRRWRVGPPLARPRWDAGQPLKLLRGFRPDREWVLEPGDMLYLPPLWGHDGVAVGDGCMTASVGFRAPRANALGAELLQRLADSHDDGADEDPGALYTDAAAAATAAPGRVPASLLRFAGAAAGALLREPQALARVLGELLTEPKREVWFEARDAGAALPRNGVRLDRRTRMLYDTQHVFINGESLHAAGSDFEAMRVLADTRTLPAAALRRLSLGARRILQQWWVDGWLQGMDRVGDPTRKPSGSPRSSE
jgi:50S ribosomal protein L16 3-hydroxylase